MSAAVRTIRIERATPEDPRTARANQLIGSVLSDRYRVDALIASGAMGSVYRGLHLNMRKQVAIKVLHPDTEDFPELVQRFHREAVAGAHISHPNVACASDMGRFGEGSYFLVLEYVNGRTLREVITKEAPMDPVRVARLGRQLASALAASHAKGIVHRDLKPRNVMVANGADEQIKLIDFGLAKVDVEEVAPLESDVPGKPKKALSVIGVVFGTVGYMAPESALGMLAVSERSDLYSLGVILYEMLSGEHPYTATDPQELFALHRASPPDPLSRGNVKVPPALEAVVMGLLEKDPAKRIQPATEVVARLEAAVAPQPPSVRGVVAAPASPPWARPSPKTIAAAVLIPTAAFALYALLGRSKPAPLPVADASSAPAPFVSASAPAPAASESGALDARSTGDASEAQRLESELIAATDPVDAAGLLVDLASVAPNALQDERVRDAARRSAEAIAEASHNDADRVFYALAYKFESDGLDLLWDIAAHSTSAKASRRASAIVLIQGATDRATPALRIAVKLVKSVCKEKPLLFPRAVQEGDGRALEVLKKLEPPGCTSCCYAHSKELEKTIGALEQKGGSK